MEWVESNKNKAPTVVYIPHISKISKEELNNFKIKKIENSDTGWVLVSPTGNGGKRKLTIHFE